MNNLIKVVAQCKNIIYYTECKRFAGHSKWANIKHIKAEKDGEKQAAMLQLTRQMKIAILGKKSFGISIYKNLYNKIINYYYLYVYYFTEGKSAKPEDNPKLAKLIEGAKKKSLPLTTIKNFLEKMQTAKPLQKAIVESRGPAGSLALIYVLSDNIVQTRNEINHQLKKIRYKLHKRFFIYYIIF